MNNQTQNNRDEHQAIEASMHRSGQHNQAGPPLISLYATILWMVCSIDAGLSLEKGDLLDGSGLDAGIMVALQGVDDGNGGFEPGLITVGTQTLAITNFDDVIGTVHADEITGSDTRNVLHSGGENDIVDGGLGHDDIFGGTGNDELQGGDGADFIFDNGGDSPQGEDETAAEYGLRLLAYDSGNDTVHGGEGSDILIYSGGVDDFYGEGGDDAYVISPFAGQAGDALTVFRSAA